MKKVISNLLYNTDTAKPVGAWDNGLYSNDFDYCAETLYRKKTGEYFIHGEGGGNSKYGVWHGNSGGPGEEIRPYTLREAQEWAEGHLTADEYIAEFGMPEESTGGKVDLQLTVLPETKAYFQQRRRETGDSISKQIDDIVKNL